MQKRTILLADDDSDDTAMFCEALNSINSDIVCQTAVNGSELLNKLNTLEEKPALIFLDLNMPVMDGWQCLKHLKEDQQYRDIPVIMISTSSHKKEMDLAIKLGALCYFVKPYHFNDLRQLLHTITENLGSRLKKLLHELQAHNSGQIFTCADDLN